VPVYNQAKPTTKFTFDDLAKPQISLTASGAHDYYARAMSSLARHAVKGVAWNWTGSVVLGVVQIASTAATARLVAPREFGLYAAAQAVGALAGFFCLRAVGQELQRRPELKPKSVGTAMTIVLAASAVVSGCVVFGAWAWAAVWGVPDAAWSIRVFGVALLLQSAAIVPLALLRRELQFGKAAVMETTAIVCGMASGVVLAIQLHSALALALGQAFGAAVLLLAAGISTSKLLELSFDPAEARGMTIFAGQVGALSFTSFVSVTLPSWFVARMFGASTLGVFSRARLMAEIPAEYAGTGIYRVIYPLYGRVRRDRARTHILLAEAMTLTAGFVWPAFGLLAGAAPLVVNIVLGPQWAGSAPYLALFSLGVCAAVPTGLLTNFAEAFGWMRLIALRQGVCLGGIAATLVAAYALGASAQGVLIGVAIVQWLTYGAILAPFVQRGLLSVRALVADQGSHAATALGAFAIGALCAAAARSDPLRLQLAAIGVGALLTLALVVVCTLVLPAGRTLRRRLVQVVPTLATVRGFGIEAPR